MKKKVKKSLVCFIMLLGMATTTVFAATHNVDYYEFEKQVSVKKTFVPTGTNLSGNVTVSKWGSNGDAQFRIKVFKQNIGSVDYQGSYEFSKKGNKNFSYTVQKGGKYTAEFWKTSGAGSIVGKAVFYY